MTNQSPIDEMLNKVNLEKYATSTKWGSDLRLAKESKATLKQTLYQLLLDEVVGGDVTYEGHLLHKGIEAQNYLRAEQRQKLAELFGVEL